jgi:uncharacterized protein
MDTLPFVGRGWETRALHRFYEEREAAFLILYGRKGVGKTRLLREFIGSEQIQDVLYWTAPSDAYAGQLQSFSQALYDFSHTPLPSPDFSFYDWEDALEFMATFIEQSQTRVLVILEGFTDLCHNRRGISSVFQKLWDHRLKEIPQLRLVLAGSHITTIIREVMGYSAPLYMRAFYQVHLRPLPYIALLDLWPDYSWLQRLLIYAVTGGHPNYLAYFDKTADITAGIQEMCFSRRSPLVQDITNLFYEPLDRPDACRAILQAVAEGDNRLPLLVQRLGLPEEEIENPLMWLKRTKLLHHHISVQYAIHSPSIRYEVAEPLVDFYYRSLLPATSSSQNQHPEQHAQAIYDRLIDVVPEISLRILGQEWLWAGVALRNSGVPAGRPGQYWLDDGETVDFPLAAADDWHKQLLLGNFFTEAEMTGRYLEEFVGRCQRVPTVRKKGWSLQSVVFSDMGFPLEIRQTADSLDVYLVKLADIERLLLTARQRIRWERENPDDGEIPY